MNIGKGLWMIRIWEHHFTINQKFWQGGNERAHFFQEVHSEHISGYRDSKKKHIFNHLKK